MKITKSKLKQLIKEELNEISMPEIQPTSEDIALGLAHDAAGEAARAVVNEETIKAELSTLSQEAAKKLLIDITEAVEGIVKDTILKALKEKKG